jgi:hypothetical protein
MKLASTTNLHRKSGTPEARDLQFLSHLMAIPPPVCSFGALKHTWPCPETLNVVWLQTADNFFSCEDGCARFKS